MITIYYYHISSNAHAALLKEYLHIFPKKFQERILRFRRWQDAQLCLSGRLLLQNAIQKHTMLENFDWNTLSYSSFGKPYLPDSDLYFNITHSGAIVACAVTHGIEIGIDMEEILPLNVVDFKSQMTTNEWNKINNAADQLQAFYEYWTKKEAVIKADGRGMSIPLLSFEIIDNTAMVNLDTFYTTKITLADRYMCHIACNQEINSNAIAVKEVPILKL